MIGHDNTVGAQPDRIPRVLRIQNPLDDQRPGPFRPDPVQIRPGDRRIEVGGDPAEEIEQAGLALQHRRHIPENMGTAPQAHIQGPAGMLRHLPHPPRGARQPRRPGQARAQVAIPGAGHRQVHGEDQGRTSRLPRPGQQVAHEPPVAQHVELEPERAGHRCSHLGDRTDAHRRKGKGYPRRLGRPRGLGLPPPGVHTGQPHRRQRHRKGDGLAEQGRPELDVGHISQHPLADFQRLEILDIPPQRGLGVAAPVEIVEQEPGQPLLGGGAIVADGGGLHRSLPALTCSWSSAVRRGRNRDRRRGDEVGRIGCNLTVCLRSPWHCPAFGAVCRLDLGATEQGIADVGCFDPAQGDLSPSTRRPA